VQITYNQADSISGTPINPIQKEGYKLVFQDEFDGNLDTVHLKTANTTSTEILPKHNTHTLKWKNGQNIQGIYPKWRVWEGDLIATNPDMKASPQNLSLQNGKLALQITQNTQIASKYGTGVIQSSAFVRFGYFEAKIKIPKGKSFWPSMWLYSSDASNCIYQEIDIMECMQNGRIDGDIIAGSSGLNGHKGTTWRYSTGRFIKKAENCNQLNNKGSYVYPYADGCGGGLKRMLDLSKDYFIYAAEWSKDSIVFYLNNTRLYAIENDSNLTKLPMGLILGGGMVGAYHHTNILCKDNLPNEYTLFPNEFSIEYVRIYKKEADFQEMLSLFPEIETKEKPSLRKIAAREFYPNNEYLLQLFTENGTEIKETETGYEESIYDGLFSYKLPENISAGNYFWRLTIQLFDGSEIIVKKKVVIR
jgi:beta-glucanase (GH16 family)